MSTEQRIYYTNETCAGSGIGPGNHGGSCLCWQISDTIVFKDILEYEKQNRTSSCSDAELRRLVSVVSIRQ